MNVSCDTIKTNFYESWIFMDLSLSGRWDALLPYGFVQLVQENTMVYLQSQEPEYMYYLKSGSVKSVILSDTGEEKILTVFSPGAIFGEASFFEGKPRISTAVTLCKSEIIRFRREDIYRAIDEQPTLAIEMLRYLSETVRMLSDHVGSMAFLSAHERVCAYLRSQANQDGAVRTTQEAIADACSLSRISVSRILRVLREEGKISTGYGEICLLDTNL